MNKIVIDNFDNMFKKSNFKEKTENRISDIVNYLKKSNIKNVIMGISGGVDSAFVLELLLAAKKEYEFTIHTVFFIHELHKNEAIKKNVDKYLENKDVNHHVFNMSGIINSTQKIDKTDLVTNTQFAYALMYTILFRYAQKYKGITFGTTNKDEFGIGWFGKTSDMVVDIQPIHDFHKFEIYNSPLIDNILDEIVSLAPNGDLLSGETDEDNFGCSYNEVSSILNLKEKNELDIHIMRSYQKLNGLINQNYHKLKKPKNEFNPIFL